MNNRYKKNYATYTVFNLDLFTIRFKQNTHLGIVALIDFRKLLWFITIEILDFLWWQNKI